MEEAARLAGEILRHLPTCETCNATPRMCAHGQGLMDRYVEVSKAKEMTAGAE